MAVLSSRPNAEPNTTFEGKFHADQCHWSRQLAIVLGAVIPDINLFVVFAYARFQGIGHGVIWGELYYSSFWQNIGTNSNSIPLFVALLLAGVWLRRHHNAIGTAMVLVAVAAIIHCLTDLPLYVDDGHPHFWPFTQWIYVSNISYWDPDHYGQYWLVFKFLVAGVCSWFIWRRFASMFMRLFVILAC